MGYPKRRVDEDGWKVTPPLSRTSAIEILDDFGEHKIDFPITYEDSRSVRQTGKSTPPTPKFSSLALLAHRISAKGPDAIYWRRRMNFYGGNYETSICAYRRSPWDVSRRGACAHFTPEFDPHFRPWACLRATKITMMAKILSHACSVNVSICSGSTRGHPTILWHQRYG